MRLVAASARAPSATTSWSAATLHHGRAVLLMQELLDQDETPLLDALTTAASAVRAPFFFPGHKMGHGAPLRLRRRFAMRQVLRHDLPELPELDNIFAPEGAILRAQELAAQAFSAEQTWFTTNGSTSGVIAAVVACVQQRTQAARASPAPPGVNPYLAQT